MMEGQTSSKGLGVSQKASDRTSYFHMADAIKAGASRANALVSAPSRRPPAPSSKPSGRAANDQSTVQTSQISTKRGLLSARQARAPKFLKTASPTDKRNAAQDTRTRSQGIYNAAKMTVGSPWVRYRKVIELKIDDFVVVAARKDGSCDLVRVLSVPEGEEAAAKTRRLHEIRHENFLAILESFSFEGSRHIILEHVSYSLAHVVASPPYPTVHQLAAILGQIVAGLSFLESQGLVHGSLGCSNVLVTAEGVIKISGHECSRPISPSSRTAQDVAAVGYIAVELMQKSPQENGKVGLEHPERWPDDAQHFLAETTSLTSAKALSKQPLLSRPWKAAELKAIHETTHTTVTRVFKFSHKYSQ